jgi:iron complex transport system permease protein
MGSAFVPAIGHIAESNYAIVLASWIGSFTVLICVLGIAKRLRDTFALLIVGLMFGSFTSAFVTVLSVFSSAEQLQKFAFWSLGNLGNLSWSSVLLLSLSTILGLAASIYCLKPLDALLLGEHYAASLGVQFRKIRLIIILATSILAGTITAFAGPIAFVGLASPHLARLLFNTGSHRIIFWGSLLVGAILLIFCDMLSQVGRDITLPINAVTSIIGAPIVIWLLIRKKTLS